MSRILGGLLQGVGQGMVSQAEQKKREGLERLRMSQQERMRQEDRQFQQEQRQADREYQSGRDEQMFGRERELSEQQHKQAMERDDKRFLAQLSAIDAEAAAKGGGGAGGEPVGYSADEKRILDDIKAKNSEGGELNVSGYIADLRLRTQQTGNPRFAQIADQHAGPGVTPPRMSREDAEAQIDAELNPGGIRGLLPMGLGKKTITPEDRQARIQSLMYGDYGSKPVGSGGGNTGSTTESIIDGNAPDAAPAEQGKSQKLDDADLDAFIDGNVKNIGRGEAKDREVKKAMQENIPFDTMNPNRVPGGMMQSQVPMPTSVTDPAQGTGGGGLLRRATDPLTQFRQAVADGQDIEDIPPEILRAALPMLKGQELTRARAALNE